jgi:hypothetical protein
LDFTESSTTPFPEPFDPEFTVTHETGEVAVHVQLLCVATFTCTVEAAGARLSKRLGVAVYVH